jgi:hypothetical protein
MSTLQTTAHRIPSMLVPLALVVALAAAGATAALVASGRSHASGQQAASPAPQRLYMGGPGEGRGIRSEPNPAPANDGSQHPGRGP